MNKQQLENLCAKVTQAVYDELVNDCGVTLAKAGAHAAKSCFRQVINEMKNKDVETN